MWSPHFDFDQVLIGILNANLVSGLEIVAILALSWLPKPDS